MNISIFDVTGPVMIGPSSSHTAGAAKLARIGRLIVHDKFTHVNFGLHGSFAKTYKGHGTDYALTAGILGIHEDDERLSRSFEIAGEKGITFGFYETELDGMHENSVEMKFKMQDGSVKTIIGSSIGGGRIIINKIDDFELEFRAVSSALVIRQRDKKGIVSEVSGILAEAGINIGVMKLSRRAKGDVAFCIIETDDCINDAVLEQIRSIEDIMTALAINMGEG